MSLSSSVCRPNPPANDTSSSNAVGNDTTSTTPSSSHHSPPLHFLPIPALFFVLHHLFLTPSPASPLTTLLGLSFSSTSPSITPSHSSTLTLTSNFHQSHANASILPHGPSMNTWRLIRPPSRGPSHCFRKEAYLYSSSPSRKRTLFVMFLFLCFSTGSARCTNNARFVAPLFHPVLLT